MQAPCVKTLGPGFMTGIQCRRPSCAKCQGVEAWGCNWKWGNAAGYMGSLWIDAGDLLPNTPEPLIVLCVGGLSMGMSKSKGRE